MKCLVIVIVKGEGRGRKKNENRVDRVISASDPKQQTLPRRVK